MKKANKNQYRNRIVIMGNDLMAYIQKLELFGFFSGYCLIYTVISSLKTTNNGNGHTLMQKLAIVLPYAYALTSTLYLGMIIKNISLNYSSPNLKEQFHVPFLQMLALFAVLFWVPFFSKKKVLSFLHSLVFFFFMLKDVFIQLNVPQGREGIQTDMKVFTDSILLNIITLIFIALTYFFFSYFLGSKKSSS